MPVVEEERQLWGLYGYEKAKNVVRNVSQTERWEQVAKGFQQQSRHLRRSAPKLYLTLFYDWEDTAKDFALAEKRRLQIHDLTPAF